MLEGLGKGVPAHARDNHACSSIRKVAIAGQLRVGLYRQLTKRACLRSARHFPSRSSEFKSPCLLGCRDRLGHRFGADPSLRVRESWQRGSTDFTVFRFGADSDFRFPI